jgi:nucleotide-binding universal stress UspA family protein
MVRAGSGRGAGDIVELRSILVPTDLSDLGRAAVPYAYGAVAAGGCVHLLHVLEAHSVPNPLYAHYSRARPPTPEERARQLADLRAGLASLVPGGAGARQVRTSFELVEGSDVTAAVCEAAERLGVDAIFVSSHGRSGVVRALLGSVAVGVLEGTRRPVLVVRPQG